MRFFFQKHLMFCSCQVIQYEELWVDWLIGVNVQRAIFQLYSGWWVRVPYGTSTQNIYGICIFNNKYTGVSKKFIIINKNILKEIIYLKKLIDGTHCWKCPIGSPHTWVKSSHPLDKVVRWFFFLSLFIGSMFVYFLHTLK
jgi:hypothetical protein